MLHFGTVHIHTHLYNMWKPQLLKNIQVYVSSTTGSINTAAAVQQYVHDGTHGNMNVSTHVKLHVCHVCMCTDL